MSGLSKTTRTQTDLQEVLSLPSGLDALRRRPFPGIDGPVVISYKGLTIFMGRVVFADPSKNTLGRADWKLRSPPAGVVSKLHELGRTQCPDDSSKEFDRHSDQRAPLQRG
jgi:hypothetical protein